MTDISGRGVGFDIVASKVRALGGSLEVHTDAGLGTNVSMRLPLTLAISRALIARVDKEIYAIPLTHVLETFALSQPMLQEVEGKEVVAIRDDLFPAIWLRDRVGLPRRDKAAAAGRPRRARGRKGCANRRRVRRPAGNRRQAIRRR